MTDAQSRSLEQFAQAWSAASAQGATLIAEAADTKEFHDQVFAWWESLDDLDDLIDDELEDILEAHGIDID